MNSCSRVHYSIHSLASSPFHPSIYTSIIHVSVDLSIHPYIYPCLSIHQPTCLLILMLIHQSIH